MGAMTPVTTLERVGRSLILFGTLGALAYFAYELVEIEFRLGIRSGVRSIAALAAPLLAGGYVFAIHRGALHRIRALPAVVRFAAALAAGALVMASLDYFLVLYPIPVAELAVASCFAALGIGSASIPGLGRPLAPLGVAAGILGYVAWFGIPRIL